MSARIRAPLSSFVGRAVELAEIRRLVGESRLVTLVGVGGVGKSRLAIEVAAAWPADVHVAELAHVTDASLVGPAILDAVGAPVRPDVPALELAAEHLAGREVLLVLDNCEHLLRPAAAAAQHLLEQCTDLRVLATSRAPLGITGETSWPVPALSLGADADQSRPPDAIRLFVERARQIDPGFAPGEAGMETVKKICREVDGLPLAIELAAARTRVLGLDQIADALLDRFTLLTSGPRGVPERQQTMRGSLEWSHDLLDEPERCLFRRLAVFVGGWSLDAARAAVCDTALPPDELLDVLARLVEKSLVVARRSDAEARYGMLETVRWYALERLHASGEADALRSRHLAVLERFAARANRENLAMSSEGRFALDRESPNLRAAIAHAAEHDVGAGLRIAAALVWYWRERGRFGEGIETLERLLDIAPQTVTEPRVRALAALAMLAGYCGDYARSAQLSWEVIELAERLGDSYALAFGLAGHGAGLAVFAPEAAAEVLERAAAAATDAGHPVLLGDVLMWQVVAATMADDEEALERRIGDTLAVAQPIEHRHALSWCAWARGVEAHAKAKPGELRDAGEAVLARSQDAVDPVMRAFALRQLAAAAAMTGEGEQLRERLREERDRCRAAGTVVPLPELDLATAELDLAAGDTTAARTVAGGMVARDAVVAGHQRWQAHHVLARAALADGDDAAALEHARQLAEHALGGPRAPALAQLVEARVALSQGDDRRAEALAHTALGVFSERGWDAGTLEALDVLGAIASHQGSDDRAARLLASVASARSDRGLVRVPPEPAYWEAIISRARSAADPSAWQTGTELSLPAAIAYARRGRGPRDRPSRGWGSLSDTELSVARLAAEGMSNGDIATRLYMSRSTVKAHLSHIYAKLNVSGRTELAAELVTRETIR